jgi:hypothetical protein
MWYGGGRRLGLEPILVGIVDQRSMDSGSEVTGCHRSGSVLLMRLDLPSLVVNTNVPSRFPDNCVCDALRGNMKLAMRTLSNT